MGNSNIKPQYTVETYINVLLKRLDDIRKRDQQQGVRKDEIEKAYNRGVQTIESTANYTGTARLHRLALVMADTVHFCKTPVDIHVCAKRTVKSYCDRDVIVAYGLENLVNKLVSEVPLECWYATDMGSTGSKIRAQWCSCVFSGLFKRPNECKDIQDDTMIAQVLSGVSLTAEGVVIPYIAQSNAELTLYTADNAVAIANICASINTKINPAEPVQLRVKLNNIVFIVRIWIGDDSSGIKGRKALYIRVFNAETMSRYRAVYSID